MSKANILKTSLIMLGTLALTACGGGGGNDGGSAATPAAQANDQSTSPAQNTPPKSQISAQFVSGDTSRYVFNSNGGFSTGVLQSQQSTDGAYRTLGSNVADGSAQMADLSGNENYAMGSWVGATLAGKSLSNYQYAVYNSPTVLPQNAAPVCQAHLTTARNGSETATITATATLSITNNIAQTNVSINATLKSGAQAPITRAETFDGSTPAGVSAMKMGTLLAGGSGVGTALGKAGNNSFIIIAPWKLKASTDFSGIAVFTCQ